MKSKLIILAATITAVTIAPAKAQAIDPDLTDNNFITLEQIFSEQPLLIVEEKQDPKPKAPVKHVVKSGDSLTKIARKYKTTWPRLWSKNRQLDNPDELKPGQKIKIPKPGEDLRPRTIPSPSRPEINAQNGLEKAVFSRKPRNVSVSGNTYSPGYCTWYVKNRRPDLPNNLGNAVSWLSRAPGHGLSTGAQPRAGAVGWQGGGLGHVVYVESVNSDGSVTVSEMNYKGLYIKSSRTVSASEFRYIY